jgi:elongator complex protein 3
MDSIQYNTVMKERPGGKDVFISAESYVCADRKKGLKDFRVVWGYCRLSLPDNDTNQISIFTENPNMKFGLIREVKVNGSITSVGDNGKSVQHLGIGSHMIRIAEEIAMQYGRTHITVTSAVGVRNYYKNKHNYMLHPCGLMWKSLPLSQKRPVEIQFDITLFVIILAIIIYHLCCYFF